MKIKFKDINKKNTKKIDFVLKNDDTGGKKHDNILKKGIKIKDMLIYIKIIVMIINVFIMFTYVNFIVEAEYENSTKVTQNQESTNEKIKISVHFTED